MDNPDLTKLSELKVDQKNLYREEVFTDMKFATIRQLTPVLPDGQKDERRKTLFLGHTQVMTPGGAIPIQFEIDAKSLKQAMELFPSPCRRRSKSSWKKCARCSARQSRASWSRARLPAAGS